MSKFDYEKFYGYEDILAISKEKYTKEEAIKIARAEFEHSRKYLAIGNGFVRHRAGVNEDGEPCVGWWLEYTEHKRSCPCWIFHVTDDKNEWCNKDYEYIERQAQIGEWIPEPYQFGDVNKMVEGEQE